MIIDGRTITKDWPGESARPKDLNLAQEASWFPSDQCILQAPWTASYYRLLSGLIHLAGAAWSCFRRNMTHSNFVQIELAPFPRELAGRVLFPLVLAFGFFCQVHLSAQVSPTPSAIVVPSNMASNDFGFGSGSLKSILRIQTVYGASLFPTGALAITELRFRPDYVYGYAFTTTVANLEVRLSTTTNAPDRLSKIFASNAGTDEKVVFSGSLGLSSQFIGPPAGPKVFDIVIPLTTPFVYAPAWGNLLVEIRNSSGSAACPLAGQSSTGDSASRLFSGSLAASSGSADTGADALQIIYTPTDAPPPPPPPPLRLARGPYLQTGTPTNIIVRWRTESPTDSRVQFGIASNGLTWQVADTGSTTEHMVTLTNLLPDTKYFYAVGTTETNLAGGPDYYFVTSPNQTKPVRIWAIGDSGSATAHLQGMPGYEGMQVAVRDAYYAFAGSRPTDVWLMLGDNAYLSGTDQQYQDTVFDIYPTLLRRCVLWPTIGNHDVTSFNGFAYLQIFSLPTQAEAGGVASGSKNYYSFDYANIHFVCLDSEVSSRVAGGPMLTWLEADLTANTNDWLIVFWHRPAYSFGTHNSDTEFEMVQMRQNAMPILEAHGVDLVLYGHSHNYERSYLIDGHYGYSYELAPAMIKDSGSGRPEDTGAYLKAGAGPNPRQGAVHVVAGSSGWVTPDGGWGQHPIMFVKLRQLGSLVIDVNTNRLDAQFLRETGTIDDHFTIIKAAGPELLRIATFRIRDGVLRTQWKSVAGQKYRVERATSVESKNWEAVSEDITATGATTGWTNNLAPGADKAFYRVVTAPAN